MNLIRQGTARIYAQAGISPVKRRSSGRSLSCLLLLSLGLTSLGAAPRENQELDLGEYRMERLSGKAFFPAPLFYDKSGRTSTFARKEGKKFRVMISGKPGPLVDELPVRRIYLAEKAKPQQQWTGPVYREGIPLYTARVGRKWFVFTGTKRGVAYDSVKHLNVSKTGEHIAFVARRNRRTFMVLDGKAQKTYSTVGKPIFSADGARLAYKARQGRRQFYVRDGKEESSYDDVREFVFAPDGDSFAYIARQNNMDRLVLNGKIGNKFPFIGGFQFDVTGKRHAYLARKDDQWLAIVDGKDGPLYDHCFSLRFSPDGSRLAYVASSGSEMFLVLDGREGSPYNFIIMTPGIPLFSPDNKMYAYRARSDEGELLILNGRESALYDNILPALFRRTEGQTDGQKGGFFGPRSRVAYRAQGSGGWRVILQGFRGEPYESLPALVLSPTGEHIAYVVQKTFQKEIRTPSKTEPGATEIEIKTVRERRLYLNGLRGDTFEDIRTPLFSPEGRRLVYIARKNGKEFVVAGLTRGKEYDHILRLFFNDEETLIYYALREGRLYRVEENEPGPAIGEVPPLREEPEKEPEKKAEKNESEERPAEDKDGDKKSGG